MTANEQPEQSRRPGRPGRPRGRFDARVDWAIIETEYIHGLAQDPTDAGATVGRHWPTFRELGARHDVSYSLVHRKAQRYGWAQRRDNTREAFTQALDAEMAKAAAVSTVEQVQYLDEYIRTFGKNIKAGRVRADVINDYDKAARLREFLLGNADSRTENTHVLTLDAMQARFKDRQVERLAEGDAHAAAALAGVIDGEAMGNPLAAAPAPPPAVVAAAIPPDGGEGVHAVPGEPAPLPDSPAPLPENTPGESASEHESANTIQETP